MADDRFGNGPREILDAFRLFYREARIEDIEDPNIVYDIKSELIEKLNHLY